MWLHQSDYSNITNNYNTIIKLVKFIYKKGVEVGE